MLTELFFDNLLNLGSDWKVKKIPSNVKMKGRPFVLTKIQKMKRIILCIAALFLSCHSEMMAQEQEVKLKRHSIELGCLGKAGGLALSYGYKLWQNERNNFRVNLNLPYLIIQNQNSIGLSADFTRYFLKNKLIFSRYILGYYHFNNSVGIYGGDDEQETLLDDREGKIFYFSREYGLHLINFEVGVNIGFDLLDDNSKYYSLGFIGGFSIA